jgi:hypothetical protein
VYSKESNWMVIDPILSEPVPARDWYQNFKTMDKNGDLLLFVSEAKRFGPSAIVYKKQGLHDPFYREYFKDLLEHYQKKFSDNN